MNHVYLHTSNLENTKILRDDENFTHPIDYSTRGLARSFQHEYGRIRSGDNFYHILVGQMRQEGCPWCGTEPLLKLISNQTHIPEPQKPSQIYFECPNCLSRGPVLNVNPAWYSNEKLTQEYGEFVRQRYVLRKPWDDGFVNPYSDLS